MRRPLPSSLPQHFTVGEALAAGVTAGRLGAADLDAPFHGIRTRRLETAARNVPRLDRLGKELGRAEAEHLQRAQMFAPRLGAGQFFGHVTAAVCWGIPLPSALLRDAPLDVVVIAPARLPRAKGIRGHQTRAGLASARDDRFTGLRLADPASTWAMLAPMLDHADLIAAGDAVVRDWRVPRPLATMEQLAGAIGAERRVGVNALRAALPSIRTRAASRPETLLRLLLLGAGLPEPQLNEEVVDGGRAIAHVDLAYLQWRIAIEYEGEHHLMDAAQWARDIARYERLAAAGWHVVRVTKDDLFRAPRVLVVRVQKTVADRSTMPVRP